MDYETLLERLRRIEALQAGTNSEGERNETLWPEFEELAKQLDGYLASVTERVIREALDGDTSEPEEGPGQLTAS